jgi:hypothetical protein
MAGAPPLPVRWERTFAVITVPANELVAPIHDRMLAILPNGQFPRWLSDEEDPRDLLVPFPAEQLESPSMGGVRFRADPGSDSDFIKRTRPYGHGRLTRNTHTGFSPPAFPITKEFFHRPEA